jgi:hypothetical protein
MIDTVSDLIDALGGNHPVATALGVQHNTVSGWRVRGLPPWACAPLRTAAELAGKSCSPAMFAIKRPASLAPDLREPPSSEVAA